MAPAELMSQDVVSMATVEVLLPRVVAPVLLSVVKAPVLAVVAPMAVELIPVAVVLKLLEVIVRALAPVLIDEAPRPDRARAPEVPVMLTAPVVTVKPLLAVRVLATVTVSFRLMMPEPLATTVRSSLVPVVMSVAIPENVIAPVVVTGSFKLMLPPAAVSRTMLPEVVVCKVKLAEVALRAALMLVEARLLRLVVAQVEQVPPATPPVTRQKEVAALPDQS
jgi:hypothetical protein